jgi:hypothetical protein
VRLGGQAGGSLAEICPGRGLSCRRKIVDAVPRKGACAENRETIVAETRLGPCIKCRNEPWKQGTFRPPRQFY